MSFLPGGRRGCRSGRDVTVLLSSASSVKESNNNKTLKLKSHYLDDCTIYR